MKTRRLAKSNNLNINYSNSSSSPRKATTVSHTSHHHISKSKLQDQLSSSQTITTHPVNVSKGSGSSSSDNNYDVTNRKRVVSTRGQEEAANNKQSLHLKELYKTLNEDPLILDKVRHIIRMQFDIELYLKRQELCAIKEQIRNTELIAKKLYEIISARANYKIKSSSSPHRNTLAEPSNDESNNRKKYFLRRTSTKVA